MMSFLNNTRRWFGFCIAICFIAFTSNAADAKLGLSSDGKGGLLLAGKPFRGIGVNYFDAFSRLLNDGKISDVENGLRVLGSNGIPFVRFSACGFWPVNWQLYQTNRAEYFRRFDQFVALAEQHRIGLIPSLFWHQPTVSDLVGEPVDQWGNASSKTLEFMRRYTREVVTRYQNSPAIWAWEFGNEFNLAADLPNAAEHRPQIVPQLGTPKERSVRDELSHKDTRLALEEFAREVRRHDSVRLILSGNAFPRPTAWHQLREGKWKKDSTAQRVEMLADDNPSPISSLCGRLYATSDLEFLKPAMKLSKRIGKPLIIGEFGVESALTDVNRKQFERWMEALDANEIPLAALWVFDFSGQSNWNVTEENGRKEMLARIAELNKRWRVSVAKTGK
jgi:hypothetical protein